MPKKRDDLAEQREEKEAQVLTREGLETRLMEEDASELGEEIADSDAVESVQDDAEQQHRSRSRGR